MYVLEVCHYHKLLNNAIRKKIVRDSVLQLVLLHKIVMEMDVLNINVEMKIAMLDMALVVMISINVNWIQFNLLHVYKY